MATVAPTADKFPLPPPSEWVNTTPHEVVIFDATGTKVLHKVPPSPAHSIRLSELPQSKWITKCPSTGVRVRGAPQFGGFIGAFPAPDKLIIVSMAVAQYMREVKYDRANVFTPDSSPEGSVRSAEGVIIGTKALCVWQW